jgi:hypothetical protein
MAQNSETLFTRAQLKEIGFTRCERASLFIKDCLFGQFRPFWPSTAAALDKLASQEELSIIEDFSMQTDSLEYTSDSVIPGL